MSKEISLKPVLDTVTNFSRTLESSNHEAQIKNDGFVFTLHSPERRFIGIARIKSNLQGKELVEENSLTLRLVNGEELSLKATIDIASTNTDTTVTFTDATGTYIFEQVDTSVAIVTNGKRTEKHGTRRDFTVEIEDKDDITVQALLKANLLLQLMIRGSLNASYPQKHNFTLAQIIQEEASKSAQQSILLSEEQILTMYRLLYDAETIDNTVSPQVTVSDEEKKLLGI